MSFDKIRVRFAPSPTGYLHVGGLRTALFNYLFARNNEGDFILRIEDTDRTRFVEGASENLISTLNRMELQYDEGPEKGGEFGPYFQSQRTEIYQKYANKLLQSNKAYYCFCSAERLEKLREKQMKDKSSVMYNGSCRKLSEEEIQAKLDSDIPYVIRAKMPHKGKTVYYDKVRGKVEFDNAEVDDQILIKSDGYPTYHLANVVDDHLMEISHVIRGEEWISSVPKHIFLYDAFQWKHPKFVHLPLLLNPDKSKLSKRQGDVAVEQYLDKGYLPEAVLNFVALLGWHGPDDKEIYSKQKLEEVFSLNRIKKAGAVFDREKLKWMNGQYIRKKSVEELEKLAKPYFKEANIDVSGHEKYKKCIKLARKRAATLKEFVKETRMFYENPFFSEENLTIMKNEKSQKIYKYWIEKLNLERSWSVNDIKDLVNRSQQELDIKGKDFYWGLRTALYGNTHGPGIDTIIDILGIPETLKRLQKQIDC